MNILGLNVPQVRDYLENIDKFFYDITENNIDEIHYGLDGEPYNPHFLNPFFDLRTKAIGKFPNLKFLIISGCEPHLKNVELYKALCKKKNWVPIDITLKNTWEFDMKRCINLTHTIDTTPRIKPKLLLCMNNGAKLHRIYIVLRLFELGLIEKSYVSLLFHHGNMNDIVNNIHDNALKQYFNSETADRLKDVLRQHQSKFPLILDRLPSPVCPNTVTDESLKFYYDSYFNITTESVWCSDEDVKDEAYEGIFFSEKTWKPISVKQPFILSGFAGSLQILRDKGYKTFSPLINEDYDNERHHQKRLEMIIEEIYRLSKFTDDQWISWQNSLLPILEHNYNHLKTIELQTKTVNF